MNPRSLLAHHLPTLTEVVDEASIPVRDDAWPSLAISSEPAAAPPPRMPVVDLSDAEPPVVYRTPTPQEVERLRGDDAPFEATISDRDIRRALAEAEAHAARADTLDLSLADVPTAGFGPANAAIDEAQLQARVLADVQRQVDALLEHRLRDALAPLLAQAVDSIATQAREVLASSLRDLVATAVAYEVERQRGR